MLDLFSGHADLYAQYRIDYPTELFDFVFAQVKAFDAAWDCATGNGQAAGILADRFTQVEATDISQQQLDKAISKSNITYRVSPAEVTPFADQTFDLITVGQAVHWFNVDAFHREVRRVAKPGAIIAEWGYGLNHVNETIYPIVWDFYRNRIGPYWDPQRRHIDDRYAKLPFDFSDVRTAEFIVYRYWNLERYLNYFRTWSSVQKYLKLQEEDEIKHDPVDELGERLRPRWGEAEHEVRFPVFLRLGKV